MKIFFIVSIIIFNVIYSSTSFAEWKKVAENSENTIYIETTSIKKSNGIIYYWILVNHTKPDKFGDLSSKTLYETDCKVPLKSKVLSGIFYNGPMGTNEPTTTVSAALLKKESYQYAPPKSAYEWAINFACNY